MKFKPNAVANAVYKVLMLVAVILFIDGLALLIISIGIISTQEKANTAAFLFYFVASIISFGVGDYLRTTAQSMLDKRDIDE